MNLFEKMREQKLLSFSLLLFTLLVGILVGPLLDTGVRADKDQVAPDATPLEIPKPVELSTAFTQLAKRLEPSVVNIQSDYVPRQSESARKQKPKAEEDDDKELDLFRRFFHGMPAPKREATGSGVIVDPKGYILTNFHVVDKADRIRVRLKEDPVEYEAKLIGADKETDLAVIKINASKSLVAARIGNSDSVQVGDWSVAIGSPFGLATTVTAGIISAKGRDRKELDGAEQFQHFLQTDAAINPGNSGGPLLNINGEVIGINTAIATQIGGYQGVGFAMPINTAVKVYNQIIKTGRVTRGSIGVSLDGFQEPSPELLKVYGATRGAFVIGVEQDSPADKAGLKEEDVIVALNGEVINSNADLIAKVSDSPVGSQATLKVVRDGKTRQLPITIGDRAKVWEGDPRVATVLSPEPQRSHTSGAKFGFSFRKLTDADREELGFDQEGGVLITQVDPASFADDAGLRENDIIVEVNRQPIRSVDDVQRIQRKLKAGDPVAFKIMRRESVVNPIERRIARTPWAPTFRAGTLPNER
jgi:serine protease Do